MHEMRCQAQSLKLSRTAERAREKMSGSNANSVFYAEAYHPIQAGSIDGTDILPHDNAVFRALLYSSAGLYDPLGDPKVIGNPYCTVFVGRLSHLTTEDTLRQAMSKYGRIKNLRLVRHIVTGASRGYAFVEFETEKEMRHAYKDAHHSFIDDCEVIVDYNRQQLMPGWIPRRLGGGLGGKKESGQLRFGGRERPFRAPLRPIPHVELKRLGIPPPPEGRYMSRFQTPSPPRSKVSSAINREGYYYKRSSSMDDWEEHNSRSSPPNKGEMTRKRSEDHKRRSQKQSSRSVERKEDGSHENKRSDEAGRRRYHNRSSFEREDLSRKRSRSSKDKSGRSRSAKE